MQRSAKNPHPLTFFNLFEYRLLLRVTDFLPFKKWPTTGISNFDACLSYGLLKCAPSSGRLAPGRVTAWFVPGLRDTYVTVSYHVYLKAHLTLIKYVPFWIDKIYAHATRSSPPRGQVYTEASGCSSFTWLLPERNSRSGAATRVNSRRYDSFRYDIFW